MGDFRTAHEEENKRKPRLLIGLGTGAAIAGAITAYWLWKRGAPDGKAALAESKNGPTPSQNSESR